MLNLDHLTENDFKPYFQGSTLKKARRYLGSMSDLARRENTLTAEVRGSFLYQVEVNVDNAGIHARCTCAYDWGGFCKHVGAVLYKWLYAPGAFTGQAGLPVEMEPVTPPPTYQPKEKPFWLTSSASSRRENDEQMLRQWLEQHRLQDLRQMAQKRNWTIKGASKAAIVEQMMAQMSQPGEILKAIAKLDREHCQVLRAMALLGGATGITGEDVERVACLWGPLEAHKKAQTYSQHLVDLGLVIPGRFTAQYWQQVDFIPRSLMRQLPPALEGLAPDIANRWPKQAHSELRLADPYALIRAANQLTVMLEQSPTALRLLMPRSRLEKYYESLKEWDYEPQEVLEAQNNKKLQGYTDLVLTVPPPQPPLPPEAIEKLAPIAGDKTRLDFIYYLLVEAGVFQPGSPVTIWQEVRGHVLRLNEAGQRALLARIYFQMSSWSELWGMLRQGVQLKRTLLHHLKPKDLAEDLARCRQVVLRVLACLPDNQWIALEDLHRLLRPIWQRFDRNAWPQGGYYAYPNLTPAWFLALNGRQLKPQENERDWEVAQGEFSQRIVAGPLHWLGLADLSLVRGRVAAFRLHGLGDLVWDRMEAPEMPHYVAAPAANKAPATAVLMDHYRIMVDPTAISAQAHAFLDRLGRLGEVSPERFVYHLDAQAVHAAFEEGVSLDQLLEDWAQFLPVPISDPIQTQLAAWWRAYGQVRIYQDVTIIEFGDEHALTEMKAITSLEKHMIAEISPQLVLIPKAAVTLLRGELEKAGYMPKQTEHV
jgi:hypothetical protein